MSRTALPTALALTSLVALAGCGPSAGTMQFGSLRVDLTHDVPCDTSLETPPDNRCDGEPLLGVDLLDIEDADGDGAWGPGEALTIELDFFTTLEPSEEHTHVNYPRIFVDVPPELRDADDAARQGVTTFYALVPGDAMQVPFTLTAGAEAPETVELTFTVGALNCVGNEEWWTPCPTPSPMRLTIHQD